MTPAPIHPQGPTTHAWWRTASPWLVTLLFALVYAAAVLLGRATRPDGSALALVWPAGAVGVVWLAWAWRSRPTVVAAHALAITVLAGTLNAMTGAGLVLGAGLGVNSGAQAVVGCLVMSRLRSRAGTGAWQLRRLSDLWVLATGSYAGAAVAAVVGTLVMLSLPDISLEDPAALLQLAVAWMFRVGTSTFVFTAVVLRLVDPAARQRQGRSQAWWDVAGAATVLTLAYAAVFGVPDAPPLAFAMVPLSMAVALRLTTTTATLHVTVVWAFVVVATLAGRGPFAAAGVLTSVLLAQAFVSVIALVTLVLALYRDERQHLISELSASERRTAEQAALLTAVIDTTTDGISVVDAAGATVLRNPAAERLLPADQLPVAQALRGHSVPGADLAVRAPGTGESRVLNISAHPLPSSPGAGWDGGAVVAFHDVTEARRSAAETARTRDLLAGVLGGATEIAIVGTDRRGRITVFNTGAQRLLGYTEHEALQTDLLAFHDPQEIAGRAAELGIAPGPAVLATLAVRGDAETRQWTYVRRDGSRVQVMLTVTAIRDDRGALTGFMGVARDLSEQLSAQADLADSEQRFRMAFQTAPVGMMMVGLLAGAPGSVLQINPAMSDLLGYDEPSLLSMGISDFTHPDDLAGTRDHLHAHAAGEVDQMQAEKRYVHRDGSTVWVRLSTTVIRPHDDEPYALALVEDITARRKAEQALTHQALHDPLTGLPNRSLFADRLGHALAAAGRSSARVGVLYLDLDGFKLVNDTAGHAAGDQLLQHVADRLSTCVRPGDTLARLGGDEFAVVCPGLDTGDDAGATATANLRAVADRVLEAVQAPVEMPSGTFRVGVSIGMALAGCGGSAEEVMQQADEAMYGAKRTGKNRVLAHDSQEQVRALRAARVLPELVDALARDELVMFGQPVVDLATGHVVAIETLVRWQHPTRGLLSPAHFLDVAEASTLMVPVGHRVLDESCRMAATWAQALGATAPCVHVNVSAGQLHDSRLVEDVLETLARHDLPGHLLVLELTETQMPLISHSLLANLERLRAVGVRIAIDDIGTGYSSLARLTELPVDILKIDLSFVAGLGTDRRCDAIVRAILGIGQALGLAVVAEGVETLEQAELLRRYGCDTVQGYLYSPPRPEDVVRGLLGHALVPGAVTPQQRRPSPRS
ncbi:MAG TPA: EAL domain-containing protein [Actinomycetales bacterium]|jgi:diguanylate cyclase (GGDEF)-like protein/PAS domain S-box-containing protein